MSRNRMVGGQTRSSLLAVAALWLVTQSASAQYRYPCAPCQPCPSYGPRYAPPRPDGAPETPETDAKRKKKENGDTTPDPAAEPDLTADQTAPTVAQATGYASTGSNMIGDLNPATAGTMTHLPPTGDSDSSAVSLYSFHVFKIADDESPFPKDRLFFDANAWENVPGTNELMRYIVGYEKTFWDGECSISIRVPFWSVDVEPTPTVFPATVPFGEEGHHSDIGDITLTIKEALIGSRCLGYVLTAGCSITFPTGPDTLGGVEPYYTYDNVSHDGVVQPWMGWHHKLAGGTPREGWFAQGFTALDLPVDRDDADYLFLDIGVGYRMPRTCGSRCCCCCSNTLITAVTPIFEAHWSAPLNNKEQEFTPTPLAVQRGVAGQLNGVLAYRHSVNLTTGVNFEICNSNTLVLAFVLPTTGPRVNDVEFIAQFNMFAH